MRQQAKATVAMAFVVLAACSGSASTETSRSSAATADPAPSVAATTTTAVATPTSPASPTTPPTAPTTTSTRTSSTVAATTAAPTAPPSTGKQIYRGCETSSTDGRGLCLGVTVPLPTDADQILATYLAFARKDLEVSSNPDAPDWDGYLSMVVPEKRAEAREDLERRFRQGQILNVAAGITYDPKLSRLRYPEGFIALDDCRTDGTYWMDRATGQPVPGEDPSLGRRAFTAELERHGEVWLITGYTYLQAGC